MKFKIFILLILCQLVLVGCLAMKTDNLKIIKINNTEIKVEVITSVYDMAQGLSGRQDLCQDCGMLFEYPNQQIMNFHMKEMNFPLDIIWIKDNAIVGVEEKVPVLTHGKITKVQPDEKVNKVLEVNAGWIEGHGIEVGALIEGLD